MAQLQNDIAHKLVFLDEPLNNLDIKHQYKALEIIKNLQKSQ
jgi:iron complex transport system ATP-binding protein